MSTEVITTVIVTEATDSSTTEDAVTSTTTTLEDFFTTQSYNNETSFGPTMFNATSKDEHYSVYEAFNIMEIVMTLLEMAVWVLAAIKMPRWRNNYRNQMLMHISTARFLKRVVFSFQFIQEHHHVFSWVHTDEAINSLQIYVDFVIVILVFFFVKHMYESVILVVVKVRQQSLNRVSMLAWLLPVPICAIWTVIIVCEALEKKMVYLLICCIFRWPLIFMGTAVYITTLYKVLSDQIRKFARSLTIVTFFMCLVINFYLFTKDVIVLWCYDSFTSRLVSGISGFIMNLLILIFYILLIILDYKSCSRTPKKNYSLQNVSIADNYGGKV